MLTEKHAKLRSEIQILLLLGRKNITDRAIAESRELLNTNIDWDYLLAASVYHGVFPTFFKHLKTNFAALVPAKCFKMMTGHNDKIRYLNLALVGTFLQFHTLLQKNNIKSVMFKGPSLAVSLYGDLLLREYSDVDVLVAPSDVRAAQLLLLESGYSPEPIIEPPLSREFLQSDVFFELECEQTFAKEVPTGVIDLHWKIQPDHILPLDFDTVMRYTTPMNLEGRTIQTLEMNLYFIVLAAHASKHSWRRLIWVCDIAQMLDNQTELNIDWQVVKQLADQLAVTPMVVLGLNLAHRIFGCQIPDFATAELAKHLQVLSDQVLLDLEILADREDGMMFAAWKLQTRLMPSWSNKLRYLATVIFHPTMADYVRLRLPLAVYKLYYVLHPFWLLQDAIRRRLATSPSSTSEVN